MEINWAEFLFKNKVAQEVAGNGWAGEAGPVNSRGGRASWYRGDVVDKRKMDLVFNHSKIPNIDIGLSDSLEDHIEIAQRSLEEQEHPPFPF
ncbi:hypothetical protein V6N12_066611 [Hibiscus sabdariffa]|uniref:Uncharacterized protein n=1 Tax=Hibiscus sabdariffa TaxID=183260 RepID=A0ABR2CQL9_9ROSI